MNKNKKMKQEALEQVSGGDNDSTQNTTLPSMSELIQSQNLDLTETLSYTQDPGQGLSTLEQ